MSHKNNIKNHFALCPNSIVILGNEIYSLFPPATAEMAEHHPNKVVGIENF